jgi:hypothetical protein
MQPTSPAVSVSVLDDRVPARSPELVAHETKVAELADALAQLASDLFAGEGRFCRLIGEFDALGGWAGWETRSCAHWLNWKLGIAMPAAGWIPSCRSTSPRSRCRTRRSSSPWRSTTLRGFPPPAGWGSASSTASTRPMSARTGRS